MNDLQDLVPRSKFDIERANAAIEAGFPAVETILPQLLDWIQDLNWPVAQTLMPFLASIGTPLAPHIRAIFQSDDEMWKYWALELPMENPELRVVLQEEISLLARRAGTSEDEIEVQQKASAVEKGKFFTWYHWDET